MINKPFSEIDKADIDELVTEKRSETKTLEYKEGLPKKPDKEIKEFLADISSFANASGGDIIYGIKAERDEDGKPTGKPGAIVGIQEVTTDKAILRLEAVIRDGLAPRFKVQIKEIDGFPKGPVILVRIPQSLSAPHMVIHRGASRFYSRNSAGKHPLDVGEIRSAFSASEGLTERTKHFREQRLAQIVADETPVPLEKSPRLVLHLVPLSAFIRPSRATQLSFTWDEKDVISAHCGKSEFRHNFDGYLGYTSRHPKLPRSYVQVFRNGIIEYVGSPFTGGESGFEFIPSISYEENLIEEMDEYFTLMRNLRIEPPILVMMSLLGVKGVRMGVGSRGVLQKGAPIDRDSLVIDDVMIEDYNRPAQHILKPVFDTIWQACGFDGSVNYDEEGDWNPPRCR